MVENELSLVGDSELDRIIEELLAAERRRQVRQKHPWVLYLIKVLWPYGSSGLARTTAIDRIKLIRTPIDLPMPRRLDETVQSTFNHHSSQSSVFARRGSPHGDDLFYSVGGKGSGRWAVHRSRVKPWLDSKRLDDI